jgi:iron complex outermembrane receptor protein
MNNSRYLLVPLVVCAASVGAQAQTTGTISGRVTNRNGGAVEAVSVGLEGQPKGDITDEQGRFRIRQVAPGQYTLIVSAVGLKTEQQTVTVVAGQTTTLNFALAESAAELKERAERSSRERQPRQPI